MLEYLKLHDYIYFFEEPPSLHLDLGTKIRRRKKIHLPFAKTVFWGLEQGRIEIHKELQIILYLLDIQVKLHAKI